MMPHAPRTKTRAHAEGEAAAEDGGVVPVAAQALAGQGVVLEQERPEVSRAIQRHAEAEEQVVSHGLDAIPVTEARVHPGLCAVSPRAANHQGNTSIAHIPSGRARERQDAALRGTACEQNTKGGLAWTRV